MVPDCPSHPQYYDIHHNVQYASGGLKSDYAGHDKKYHHNLNVGGGNCGSESRGILMTAIASSVPEWPVWPGGQSMFVEW